MLQLNQGQIVQILVDLCHRARKMCSLTRMQTLDYPNTILQLYQVTYPTKYALYTVSTVVHVYCDTYH